MFFASGVSAPLFYAEALGEYSMSALVVGLAAVLGQLLVTGYGVWRCYHANGGASGQRFAETFIAIAWVVGVRVFLAAIIPFIALLTVVPGYSSPAAELFVLVFTAIYFWRIWVQIGWVHQHRISAA